MARLSSSILCCLQLACLVLAAATAGRLATSASGLAAATAVAAALHLAGMVAALRHWRHGPGLDRWWQATFVWAVALWLLQLAAIPRFSPLATAIFWSFCTLPLPIARLLGVAGRPWLAIDRWPRTGNALFELALAIVAIEVGLGAICRLSSAPVFLTDSDSIAADLERRRIPPGTMVWGYPADSRGYVDAELDPASSTPLAVSIGDSFQLPNGPQEFHFTSIAERLLAPMTVYSMGVPGIGLGHMAYFVRDQAVPLEPDIIVVTLFASGLCELENPPPLRSWPLALAESWLARERVHLVQTLLPVLRRASLGARPRPERHLHPGNDPIPTARILADRPWLVDPLAQEPELPEDDFLALERRLAAGSCIVGRLPLGATRQALQELVRAAGRIPLAALVMPDEFQIEDALWQAVAPPAGPGILVDRDLASDTLMRELHRLEIPAVDLTPLFRAAPPLDHQRRILYRPRSTHLNARGDAIAGRALATLVRSVLRLPAPEADRPR